MTAVHCLYFYLQNVDSHIVEARCKCRRLIETLNEVRDKADEAFGGLFERATDITNANDIQISKSRTSNSVGCPV